MLSQSTGKVNKRTAASAPALDFFFGTVFNDREDSMFRKFILDLMPASRGGASSWLR